MIGAARAAFARGDARGALVALLAAWRERPARVLAEAIEAVGLAAARGMHAPGGGDLADRREKWFAEAAHGDPVMRQRLVETIAETSPPGAGVERARVLVETETDPRTAMAMVALATSSRMPWHEAYSTVWNPLFDLLARSGDPRVREAIVRAPWSEIVRGTRRQKEAFRARLDRYDWQLAKALPEEVRLAYDETRAVEEIIAMARAPVASEIADREMEAALLAAVRAAPGDLGARAIYADWLQEHGDPRGEFIMLQMSCPSPVPPETRMRLEQLLGQHRAKWLGGVAQHLAADRFRNGFLDEVQFRKQAGYGTPYAVPPPDPLWSTVRIARGGVPASDELPMPGLEIAHDIDHRGLRTLARLAHPPPLRELWWMASDPGYDAEALADFATIVRRVPTLHRFAMRGRGAEEMPWAWRGSSIRALVVEAPTHRLGHWLAEIAELDEVSVKHDGWSTVLYAKSGALHAQQGYSGNFAEVLPHLEAVIDRLGDRLAQVHITVTAKAEWRAPERRRMEALLARHPRWGGSAKFYGFNQM